MWRERMGVGLFIHSPCACRRSVLSFWRRKEERCFDKLSTNGLKRSRVDFALALSDLRTHPKQAQMWGMTDTFATPPAPESPPPVSGRLDASDAPRSEEHTSELQSLMRISYAVFCLKKKKQNTKTEYSNHKHN